MNPFIHIEDCVETKNIWYNPYKNTFILASSNYITCSCDDGDKVLHPLSVAKLLLSQGSAVAVIVHPDGQLQHVGDGCPQVHRGPLLDQLGGMQHHSFLGVHTPPGGDT